MNQAVQRTAALTSQQKEIIKATAPILQEHGEHVTTLFYRNLLDVNPDLNNVFSTTNQSNGEQPRALAGALLAYASNIDNLGALGSLLELICSKHASLYIQPEDYEIVAKYLIAAMGEVLGSAFTEEIRSAWEAAYWNLANVMIEREAALSKQSDGWTTWRDFRVASKIPESNNITSFYLKPADGQPLPLFRPGQFISLRVNVPDLHYLQARQYSLSDEPRSDYYRISVKRELGKSCPVKTKTSPGHVSNVLHDVVKEGDVVQVSHPFGDFFLSDGTTNPIVLLSAGVGITPLMSILNSIGSSNRKVHFIHGSRTAGDRAFKNHTLALAEKYNFRTTFFTTKTSPEDEQGITFKSGRIDLEKLDPVDLYLDDPETEFYVCGPGGFMIEQSAKLKSYGVGSERVKMELFGTGGLDN